MKTDDLRKLAECAGYTMRVCADHTRPSKYKKDDRFVFVSGWTPHTDISQAFEVIAGLRAQGFNNTGVYMTLMGEQWETKFGKCDEHGTYGRVTARGATPAEAICKAALLAIGGKQDG